VVDGGDASFDHQRAAAAFDPVTIGFTLDGAAPASIRTPITPFHDPASLRLCAGVVFPTGQGHGAG
jgi:hypothetical protein